LAASEYSQQIHSAAALPANVRIMESSSDFSTFFSSAEKRETAAAGLVTAAHRTRHAHSTRNGGWLPESSLETMCTRCPASSSIRAATFWLIPLSSAKRMFRGWSARYAALRDPKRTASGKAPTPHAAGGNGTVKINVAPLPGAGSRGRAIWRRFSVRLRFVCRRHKVLIRPHHREGASGRRRSRPVSC